MILVQVLGKYMIIRYLDPWGYIAQVCKYYLRWAVWIPWEGHARFSVSSAHRVAIHVFHGDQASSMNQARKQIASYALRNAGGRYFSLQPAPRPNSCLTCAPFANFPHRAACWMLVHWWVAMRFSASGNG